MVWCYFSLIFGVWPNFVRHSLSLRRTAWTFCKVSPFVFHRRKSYRFMWLTENYSCNSKHLLWHLHWGTIYKQFTIYKLQGNLYPEQLRTLAQRAGVSNIACQNNVTKTKAIAQFLLLEPVSCLETGKQQVGRQIMEGKGATGDEINENSAQPLVSNVNTWQGIWRLTDYSI